MVMRRLLCIAAIVCWNAHAQTQSGGPRIDDQVFAKEDLLFTEMDVDKRDVYQGEAILLTMQLWRIKYRLIETGSSHDGLIIPPSTEGFYVTPLRPAAYTATKGRWQYDVTEERSIIYPTAVGALSIGEWHWEGMALVSRKNSGHREKLHYRLTQAPIGIEVKPLPTPPSGFSGAVGDYRVEALVGGQAGGPLTQGVPATFVVNVTGTGNPHAIGDPRIPALHGQATGGSPMWAFVGEPERSVQTYSTPKTGMPTVTKRFTFTLTPLRAGRASIPEARFTFFDPETEDYMVATTAPIEVTILPSNEARYDQQAESAGMADDDVRPPAPRPEDLQARRPSTFAWSLVVGLPVAAFLFFGVAVYGAKVRRDERRPEGARSIHARPRALKRLRGLDRAKEPFDALHGAVIDFVADTFSIDGAGATSEDIERILEERGVADALKRSIVTILKACERARYGNQEFSPDEIRALVEAALACVSQLSASRKRKGLHGAGDVVGPSP